MAPWLGLALLGLLAAGLIAHVLMAAAFRRRTGALVAALAETGAGGGAAARPPPMVEAHARRALSEGGATRLIRLRQRGTMRLRPGGSWRPFRAEQSMSVAAPGFVWRARVRLAPLIGVEVVDALVDGVGLLEARLFGSVPLARASGPELDRGELMRYLAELVFAPDAMLHNRALGWRELAAQLVEVSAGSTAGQARVRLVFEAGDIVRIEATDRPRDEAGRMVSRPWSGRFSAYRIVGGRRVPTRAEVSWLLDDGPFVYWRGEVVALATVP